MEAAKSRPVGVRVNMRPAGCSHESARGSPGPAR
jgi:hypothetical protein